MARSTRDNYLDTDATEGPAGIRALATLGSGVNPDGTPFTLPVSVDPGTSEWHAYTAGLANAVATASRAAAGAGLRNFITHIIVGLSGSPAMPIPVDVRFAGAVVARTRILVPQLIIVASSALRGGVNEDVDVTVAAAGVGISADVSIFGYSR